MPPALLPLLLAALTLPVTAAPARPLENHFLRCCVAPESPVLFSDGSIRPYGYDGLAINYLRHLQPALGFRCASLTHFPRHTFNTVIDTMHECTTRSGEIRDAPECNCDMGVGGWFLNRDRIGKVDFLPPFALDGVAVVTHVSHTSSAVARGAFFLAVFTLPVWALIFALVTLFALLKMLDRRFARPGDEYRPLPESAPMWRRIGHFLLKSRIFWRLRLAIQSTLSRIFDQGASDPVLDRPSCRQWMLNLFIVLCSLFLVLAYESGLTAMLVQDKLVSGYNNLQDLKRCGIPPQDVCVPKGGAIDSFWNNSVAQGNCHNGKKPVYFSKYEDGINNLLEGRCKYMLTLSASGHDLVERRHCGRLIVTGELALRTGLSFVLPLHSNLTKYMSEETVRMTDAGVLPSPEDYVRSSGLCPEQVNQALNFEKLRLFFYTAFVACGLHFLCIVLVPQSSESADVENNDTTGDRPVAAGVEIDYGS